MPDSPAAGLPASPSSPPRRKLLASGLGLATAAAAGALGWWTWHRQAGASSPLWQSQFETPDGRALRLSDYRGAPLLVNFWASWCVPCVKELPLLDRFSREFAAQGWRVVGLAVDNAPAVKAFLARQGVGFDVGITGFGGADLARALGNPSGALPYTCVFDAMGRQRFQRLGETNWGELNGWARQLHAASSPA